MKSLFCSSKQMYPANANAEVPKNCFRPGKEMGISYMLTLLKNVCAAVSRGNLNSSSGKLSFEKCKSLSSC